MSEEEQRIEEQVREEEAKEEVQEPEPVPEAFEKKEQPVFRQGTLKCKSVPDIFKNILSASNIVGQETIPFYFDEQGLTVRLMNPSHSVMLDAFVSADDFDVYECNGVVNLGLPISRGKGKSEVAGIDKYIDRAKTAVELIVKSGELVIIAENKDRKATYTTHYYEAPILTPVPKMSLSVKLNIEQELFLQSIEDVALVSKKASFQATEGALVISAKGDTGKCEIPFGGNSMFPIDITVERPASSTYDIEEFGKMVKVLTSGEISFEFSTNHPCKLTAKLLKEVTNTISGSKMAFYLAPRVDDEAIASAKATAKEAVKQAKTEEAREQEAEA